MEMRTDVVERTLDELIAAGLQGFVPFAALPASPVPGDPAFTPPCATTLSRRPTMCDRATGRIRSIALNGFHTV